jgi:phage portal protein BeeE
MPKLWRALSGRSAVAEVERADPEISLDDWLNMFGFGGLNYMLSGTSASQDREAIENSFIGYVNGLYKTDGVVFACMEARRSLFTEARFQWQRIKNGRPLDLFGTPELALLETPWPNGTTGELLSRAIQDVDLAGNHYVVREPTRLRRLRPDWVEIVLSAPPDQAVQSDVVGYIYWPGGIHNSPERAKIYTVDEVAHWCPIPDPEAQYRGMSWLTPVIPEILSDKQATAHKEKFYGNAATPKLAVSLKETVTKAQFMDFMAAFSAANDGIENAYKTLYLGGGADVSLIGANMVQMDFKNVQGAGETRIAAAARVHPVIVGLSEGMQGSSLNAGNYKTVKESFGDQTLRPLWRSVAAAYQTIIRQPRPLGKDPIPGTIRLWYDDRDVSFLRTDRKDEAEILNSQAETISKLITAGFEPDSVVKAVTTGDMTELKHSGLVSVQLLPPGESGTTAEGGGSLTPPAAPAGTPPKGSNVPSLPSGQKGITVKPPKRALERHGSKSDPGYFVYHPGSAAKSGTLKDGGNKRDKNLPTPLTYYQLDTDEDQYNQDLDTYWNYSADGWSDPVANYLRTGESDPDEVFSNEEMDDMVSAMDGVAASHVLAESIPLFRVAPGSVYGDVPDGTVVTDKAFMSTTGHKSLTEKYRTEDTDVVIRVDMPAGAHMIPHHHLGGGAKGEVILPRNMPLRKVRTDGDVIVYEPVF